MSLTLYLKRRFKSTFLKFHLHRLVEPFSGALLNLAYVSKFSAWRAQNAEPAFNDFFASGWDYKRRYDLYQYLLKSENLDSSISYLEFGVAQGHSFKWWVEHNKNQDSKFWGFDTFTGLPEQWDQFEAGAMSVGGQFPEVNDERAKFVKGLFQDTLSDFLKTFDNEKRKIIHLDADLYSSTLYVLTMLDPYLKKDDILIFDEFGVPTHEFLAYVNYLSAYRRDIKLIGAANNYFFTAFKVIK